MKQIIIWLLALGMCSINLSAQTKKPARKTTTQTKPKAQPTPKDSREYQVGNDGFEWYKICKNGKFGAESINGQLLIPTEYTDIEYDYLSSINYGCTNGFWAKMGKYYSYYNLNGKCIIPYTRHYIFIFKTYEKEFGTYYRCDKEDGIALCDISGKQVCSIKFDSNVERASPTWSYGKFYFTLKSKEGLYGLADGNGKVIIPPTKKIFLL